MAARAGEDQDSLFDFEAVYDHKGTLAYDTGIIQRQQAAVTACALKLLGLDSHDRSRLILDAGCGTGMCGDVIQKSGHQWMGTDISPAMLQRCVLNKFAPVDLCVQDIGQLFPFRDKLFDGALAISAVHWLCEFSACNASCAEQVTDCHSTVALQ
jgi:SAM-dependent methyltransferase